MTRRTLARVPPLIHRRAARLAIALTLASATAGEIEGQVVAIDRTKKEIMLNNGLHYSVDDKVSIVGLKVGTEVKITYAENDLRRTVTRIVRIDRK